MIRNSNRYTIALSLHFMLVTGVLLNLVFCGIDQFAVQNVQRKQRALVNSISLNSPLLVRITISEQRFLAIRRNERECVINEEFFEIVHLFRNGGQVVLSLLPDREETAIHKRMKTRFGTQRSDKKQRMASVVAGFLFFEEKSASLLGDVKVINPKPDELFEFYLNPHMRINSPPPEVFGLS